METKKLTMKEEIVIREVIDNQISVNKQEEAHTALEAKYNSTREAIEQDLLRAQIDRANEVFENDLMEHHYIEKDNLDDWDSVYDNPYYDDNLDMDQQSPEFWDNL